MKFRDLSFIWEVFTQLFFYVTPIIYPMSLILEKHKIGRFILLNPLAQVIQDLRYILVTPQAQTSWQQLGGLAVLPVISIFFISAYAVRYFRKESKTFAENV